jgi:hypothetical protein
MIFYFVFLQKLYANICIFENPLALITNCKSLRANFNYKIFIALQTSKWQKVKLINPGLI